MGGELVERVGLPLGSRTIIPPSRSSRWPAGLFAAFLTGRLYGVRDGYHGKRTANGERFNTCALTAAHRTRRFGRHVTVTNKNKANGRSARVRITDRGPFIKGRCIDLSGAAANAIVTGVTARVTVQ